MAGFANIKIGTNINEWLNEIAFITSEMSDPMEPQHSNRHGDTLT